VNERPLLQIAQGMLSDRNWVVPDRVDFEGE
jgi:hypothetical protein